MQSYYRYGEFDNCFGKWGDLVDCFALKTKRAAEVEAILVAREEAMPHIWTYHTIDEATSHWVAMYSHSIKPGDKSNHLVEVVRQLPPASVPRRALFPGLAAASAAVPPPPFPGLVAATAAGPPPSPKFGGS
ncbi:hypothetical protein E2562_023374 [Oryza meyeriana var. granulata]|uniref:Uncharacterized protein n=1 Tax=Oryza meyeriana var. granulata TaxID=110450 RepID=A0A6G1E0J4_9ORYZ|nr:hypothetical protein E2562_023374 [Oryza meyeriana var. granulata]